MKTVVFTAVVLTVSACATNPICDQTDLVEKSRCEERLEQSRQLRLEREFGRNR
jgi:hypothetical protein